MQIVDIKERIEKIRKSGRTTIINTTTGEEIYTNPRDCMKLYEQLCAKGGNFSLYIPTNKLDRKIVKIYKKYFNNKSK